MNPPQKTDVAVDRREPRTGARRRARVFEAFMGEQALALHRTVATARQTVRAPRVALRPDTAPCSGIT
jgi:hypothetical protein